MLKNIIMTKKDKAEEKFIIGKPYLELNEEVNFNPAFPWFRKIYPIYPLADKKKRSIIINTGK